MKLKISGAVVAISLLASNGLAIDPFPRQPKMSAAYNRLAGAMEQIEKSRYGAPEKHKKGALVDLAMAKSFLEDAAKNKGSYGQVAVHLIEEATKALETTPSGDKQKEEALGDIKKAREEISRGAQAARH